MNALLEFIRRVHLRGKERTDMTANMMYVLYLMLLNATGVIITTMKLNSQFPDVERALAGALILRGTISAKFSLKCLEEGEQAYLQDTAKSFPANQQRRRH